MAAIGNSPTQQAFTPAIDYFSGTGSATAFTLSRPVASVAQVQVTIDNVAQNPSSAYTVSANTITFTSAPLSGTNNIYVYYTSPITQVIAPGQGTVNTTALGNITNIASGNSSLTLQTGSSPTTAVTINTSQNVGIGTTTINNAVTTYRGAGVNNYIQFTNSTTGTASTDGCLIGVAADDTALRLRVLEAAPMIFTTNDTERMRIDSSGNLLVGTSSVYNSAKVSINQATAGSVAMFIYKTVAGDVGTAGLQIGKTDNNTTTSQVFIQFLVNSANNANGQINANGASQAAFGTYSDSRLKENITNLPSQLANIMALRPVEFDYIESEGGGHQIGFVAQEVKEIYPDLVGERADGMFTLSDLNKNDARLIKAIQELKAINDTQAETINALTARIVALENR
jgi:hypothetical protein